MRWTLVVACCVAFACGRGPAIQDGSGGGSGERLTGSGGGGASATGGGAPGCAGCRSYHPGTDGFVVHEWGTLTSVMTSTGQLVQGLHHEEEDLPGFVADRIAAAKVTPGAVQKMETPVTYFYSPTARDVQVKVAFPEGLFTQWFPYVQRFEPFLYGSPAAPDDPWTMANVSMPAECASRFTAQKGGVLDWGTVKVLAPEAQPSLASPIGAGTWGFSREVASNTLEVAPPQGGLAQHERFLFYRGLGNFSLPMTVAEAKGTPVLQSAPTAQTLRGIITMKVTATGGSFAVHKDLPPGETEVFQFDGEVLPMDRFVAELSTQLETLLVADGLYTDEAKAMVHTWQRSYFRTPGQRVLYLLPAAQIDATIPLTITPAPATVKRTMVIRVEALSSAEEQQVAAWAKELATAPSTARAKILGLGRFAEPKLRAALPSLGGADAANAQGADRRAGGAAPLGTARRGLTGAAAGSPWASGLPVVFQDHALAGAQAEEHREQLLDALAVLFRGRLELQAHQVAAVVERAHPLHLALHRHQTAVVVDAELHLELRAQLHRARALHRQPPLGQVDQPRAERVGAAARHLDARLYPPVRAAAVAAALGERLEQRQQRLLDPGRRWLEAQAEEHLVALRLGAHHLRRQAQAELALRAFQHHRHRLPHGERPRGRQHPGAGAREVADLRAHQVGVGRHRALERGLDAREATPFLLTGTHRGSPDAG